MFAARYAMESLTAQVSDLSTRLLHLHQESSSSQNHLHSPEPRINHPPCYVVESTECRPFLTQYVVVFSLQPQTYAGECFEQRRHVRGSFSRQQDALPPAIDSPVSRPDPEPMQLGGICLSPTERQRQIQNCLCLYCGAAGHFAS